MNQKPNIPPPDCESVSPAVSESGSFPIPNGCDRGTAGRFAPGNKAAAGRGPSKYSTHRKAVQDAVITALTPSRIVSVIEAMIALALDETQKAGDRQRCAELVLQRGLGSVPHDVEAEERLAEVERAIAELRAEGKLAA